MLRVLSSSSLFLSLSKTFAVDWALRTIDLSIFLPRSLDGHVCSSDESCCPLHRAERSPYCYQSLYPRGVSSGQASSVLDDIVERAVLKQGLTGHRGCVARASISLSFHLLGVDGFIGDYKTTTELFFSLSQKYHSNVTSFPTVHPVMICFS